jgi:hypothetical protein
MVCSLCGFQLTAGARFCSSCGATEQQRAEAEGKKIATPPPRPAVTHLPTALSDTTPQPENRELGREINAAEVAEMVKDRAAVVQQELQKQLDNPVLLEAIPGRSLSVGALGIMAVAMIIGQLPVNFFAIGMGMGETLFYLLGGALVALLELKAAGVEIPVGKKIPAKLQHPLLPPLFAILLLFQAILIFSVRLTPLLFVLGALVFAYDQYRKAKLSAHGFNAYFDLAQLRSGYRAWLPLAMLLCIVSLFFTWSNTPTMLMGGMETNLRYNSNIGGYAYKSEYNPAQMLIGGWAVSGRAQEGVIVLLCMFAFILLWASWHPGRAPLSWMRNTAIGLSGFLVFGGLFSLKNYIEKPGRWIFAAAAVMTVFAVYKLWKGEQAGVFDPAHVMATAKEKLKARAATHSG